MRFVNRPCATKNEEHVIDLVELSKKLADYADDAGSSDVTIILNDAVSAINQLRMKVYDLTKQVEYSEHKLFEVEKERDRLKRVVND